MQNEQRNCLINNWPTGDSSPGLFPGEVFNRGFIFMLQNTQVDEYDKLFSLFLIGCNPVNTVAHTRTIAFKDLRRLMRGICKGPINPRLYGKFSIADQNYFSPNCYNISLRNQRGDLILIDNAIYPYFKNWIFNIESSKILHYWR